jgi:hypothetical protein
MPISPPDAPAKRRGRPWVILLVILALLPLAAWTVVVLMSLLLSVQRWGPARVYRVSGAATYPPPGISGVSYARGRWYRQNLRTGDWVLEWYWLPRERRAPGG